MDHPRITRRRFGAVLVAGLGLSGLAACGGGDAPAPAASTPTPTPAPPPPPPPPPPPVLWPLTGLESGQVPLRPALAVKIENSSDARPQTGLNAADVVWEQVVEGGITRYVAVYHSTVPPEIGPVRSIRPMDPAIAAPLRGLLAFSGGQRPYVDAAAAAGLQVLSMDGRAGGFSRVGHRSAPHNVYVDPNALLAQADPQHAAPPPPQFDFAEAGAQPSTLRGGTPAASVQLSLSRFGRPVWTWSQPDGRWVRTEGTTPAVDADGTPLRAVNVVVLRVDVVDTTAKDPAGNPVPETVLVGSGEALVATAGHTLPGRWVKHAVGDRLFLTGPDGNPVRLAAGNTWVELVPNGTGAVTVG